MTEAMKQVTPQHLIEPGADWQTDAGASIHWSPQRMAAVVHLMVGLCIMDVAAFWCVHACPCPRVMHAIMRPVPCTCCFFCDV